MLNPLNEEQGASWPVAVAFGARRLAFKTVRDVGDVGNVVMTELNHRGLYFAGPIDRVGEGGALSEQSQAVYNAVWWASNRDGSPWLRLGPWQPSERTDTHWIPTHQYFGTQIVVSKAFRPTQVGFESRVTAGQVPGNIQWAVYDEGLTSPVGLSRPTRVLGHRQEVPLLVPNLSPGIYWVVGITDQGAQLGLTTTPDSETANKMLSQAAPGGSSPTGENFEVGLGSADQFLWSGSDRLLLYLEGPRSRHLRCRPEAGAVAVATRW